MKSALYGIYALFVDISEISLVHSFDLWYKNNDCVNTVQSTFHAVLCLLYTYWNILHFANENNEVTSEWEKCQQQVKRNDGIAGDVT